MSKYVGKRLLHAMFVILGVATVAFFLVRLTGDPIAILMPADATVEQMDAMRAFYGLDRPVYVQYGVFLQNLLRLDLGDSLRYHQPVLELILERIPYTLELAVSAMLLALIVALPTGIFMALKRGTLADQGTMAAVSVLQAMPVFWLGILLMMLFSVRLKWLPTGGYGSWKQFILPTVALSTNYIALVARLLRSSLIEVMDTDYIRTARAKGLLPPKVIQKHAFRNSMLPVVTVIGLQFGGLLGGSIVTETVFSWPGIGQLLVNAISYRDFPTVQGCVILLSTIFVLINLLVDIFYVFIDPRITYEQKR
ncbi:MAG: ABC transporter permease [Clostridiales bacterium]|nr:ABC transporter permease [Clostridiales bacterium]